MKVVKVKLNNKSHSKLELNSLTVGEVLVYDIWIKKDTEYSIIIKAGTKLIDKLFKELEKQENLYISAGDKNKKDLTSESLLNYIKYNKSDYKKALSLLYQVNNNIFSDYMSSTENKINITSIDEIVKSMVYLVQNDSNYLKETIPYFKDEYELDIHSLHVAIYSISLGNILDFSYEELLKLGTAGLLHDLGLKDINDSIRKKESKLDQEELDAVSKHARHSAEIVKKNSVHNPYIIEAIMHHHEAQDGSGYPEGLIAENISPFASILSISDNFDALTSNRPYREKYSTFEALKKMMKEESMANKFNQNYLRKFLESLLA